MKTCKRDSAFVLYGSSARSCEASLVPTVISTYSWILVVLLDSASTWICSFFLEDLLGSRVDLVTLRGLREELREDVEREAIRVA